MNIRTRTIYRQGFRATFDGDGNLLEADEGFPWGAENAGAGEPGAAVIADIAPYQSQVTGEMITSRSQHREHLKRHRLIEIGNEVQHMMKPRTVGVSPESRERRKRLLHQVVDDNLGYLKRGRR